MRQHTAMKNVLLIKAGEAALAQRLRIGDYDRWFLEAIGSGWRMRVCTPYSGEPLPELRGFDAVMMTGSPLSVTEAAEWMRRSGDYLREAGERGVPVLGVCFGHQLLSVAYGGRVIRGPSGREIGTVEMALSDEGARDFLFRGIPRTFAVQATHEDLVPELPPGAALLARNTHTPVQAMAFGARVRGVQFHPELSPEGMRAVIECKQEKLEAEGVSAGLAPGERVRGLLAGIRPTPCGRKILENFLAYAAGAPAP